MVLRKARRWELALAELALCSEMGGLKNDEYKCRAKPNPKSVGPRKPQGGSIAGTGFIWDAEGKGTLGGALERREWKGRGGGLGEVRAQPSRRGGGC